MKRQRKDIYHRKIWEEHYGPIPRDRDGRSYEIHHVDGNHKNNDVNNLLCVTIEEHYKIHYEQGDYAACMIMFDRMKVSPQEKSRIAKLANTGENNPMHGTKWITNGTTNKKIGGNDLVPTGWWYGRTFCEKLQETFVHRSKSGSNNPRYDSTPYRFVNEKEGISVVMPKYDFSKTYNVRGKAVRELVRGRISSYKGWTANIC